MHPVAMSSSVFARMPRSSPDQALALVDALTRLLLGIDGRVLDEVGRAHLARTARTARELAEAGAYVEVYAAVDALERFASERASFSASEVDALQLALSEALASVRAAGEVQTDAEARLLVFSIDPTLFEEVDAAFVGAPFEVVRASDERAVLGALHGAHIAFLHGPGTDRCVRLAHAMRETGHAPPFALLADAPTLAARAAAAQAGAGLFLTRPLGPLGVLAAARQLLALREIGPARVLVLDTDEARAEGLVSALHARGLEAARITDPEALEDTLARLDPDALVVGAPLPGVSPDDVCRVLRAAPEWQTLPIFVSLASDDPGARELALEAGADDASVRWRPADLVARVRSRTRQSRMLREHASYDGLTGLLARGTFLDAAGPQLVAARRAGQSVAFGLIRVGEHDDANGRSQEAIVRAAALLAGRFGTPHLRGRWGPRDLVVLVTGARAPDLCAELADIRDRLAGDFVWVTPPRASLATAHLPEDGTTIAELLRVAQAGL